MSGATQAQIEELAAIVSAQAASIGAAKIPPEDYRAKVLLMLNNVSTLEAWTGNGPEGQEWHMMPGARKV